MGGRSSLMGALIRGDEKSGRVFRVGRPTRHDHAVDHQRRDREDVENADIKIGDLPFGADRDHRPGGKRKRPSDKGREQKHAFIGTGGNDRFFEHELTLSKDEYLKVVESRFKAADPDNDGTLDESRR